MYLCVCMSAYLYVIIPDWLMITGHPVLWICGYMYVFYVMCVRVLFVCMYMCMACVYACRGVRYVMCMYTYTYTYIYVRHVHKCTSFTAGNSKDCDQMYNMYSNSRSPTGMLLTSTVYVYSWVHVYVCLCARRCVCEYVCVCVSCSVCTRCQECMHAWVCAIRICVYMCKYSYTQTRKQMHTKLKTYHTHKQRCHTQ